MNEHALATTQNQLTEFNTLEGIEKVAKHIAGSAMFGITRVEQAVALMMISIAEGIHPLLALRRYHLIEGKPSFRADALAGEFQTKVGPILYHSRTDQLVAATFFGRKEVTEEDIKKAKQRFKLQWQLMYVPINDPKYGKLLEQIDELGRPDEITVIRTLEDADQKGLSTTFKDGKEIRKKNWEQHPRQMLTARVVSEGVRLIAPQIIAGIYVEEEERDRAEDERNRPKTRFEIEAKIAALNEQLATENDKSIRQQIFEQRSELQWQLDQMPPPKKVSEPIVSEATKTAAQTEPTTQAVSVQAELLASDKTTKTTRKKAEKPAGAAKEAEKPAETAPPPQDTSEAGKAPESGANAQGEADPDADWKDYVVKFVPLTGIKDMKLSEVTPEAIAKVKEKWIEKQADTIAKDPAKVLEAKMFLAAHRHHFPR